MSRSGYSEDIDQWALIRWRGAVASAIRGKRGQAFLGELLSALDALPERRLVAHSFQRDDGCVCALGAVAKVRGLDVKSLDAYGDECDTSRVGDAFGIPRALAAEIMFENDDPWSYGEVTPEVRFQRVRKWVVESLRLPPSATTEVPK